jgi:hypothetical protein
MCMRIEVLSILGSIYVYLDRRLHGVDAGLHSTNTSSYPPDDHVNDERDCKSSASKCRLSHLIFDKVA